MKNKTSAVSERQFLRLCNRHGLQPVACTDDGMGLAIGARSSFINWSPAKMIPVRLPRAVQAFLDIHEESGWTSYDAGMSQFLGLVESNLHDPRLKNTVGWFHRLMHKAEDWQGVSEAQLRSVLVKCIDELNLNR